MSRGKFIMKTQLITLMIFVASSLPVLADTTVTVDQGKVVVDQNASRTVVVQKSPVIFTEANDPREIEGEIIRVDIPARQIVVEDIDGRDHKVLLKQGMIGNYKVGDYVKIYLMADLKEAKTIQTYKTADLEGDIINLDYDRNQIVVRESNASNRIVVMKPGVINQYKAGDRVRFYVVSDATSLAEARVIRVR